MKKESKQNNASILALVCSSVALMAAVFFANPSPATADFAVKDRDFQIITAGVASGSDALYVLDNRSGQVAVFLYDTARRGLQIQGRQQISDAFGTQAR